MQYRSESKIIKQNTNNIINTKMNQHLVARPGRYALNQFELQIQLSDPTKVQIYVLRFYKRLPSLAIPLPFDFCIENIITN